MTENGAESDDEPRFKPYGKQTSRFFAPGGEWVVKEPKSEDCLIVEVEEVEGAQPYGNRVAVNSYEEYRSAHRACPQCGSLDIFETTAGFLWNGPDSRDTNRATCQACNWTGILHDLVTARPGEEQR